MNLSLNRFASIIFLLHRISKGQLGITNIFFTGMEAQKDYNIGASIDWHDATHIPESVLIWKMRTY